MKYKNEAQIMKALGIESWRNLSKDKMVRFAAMMPNMDTEVALKIVEQFPAFKNFAKDAVSAIERAHQSTFSANNQSQERVHRAWQEVRDILKGELGKDDLGREEKKFLIEQIQETARMQSQKDSENKQFLDGALKKVLVGATAAVALGVAFVGGRVMAESKDSTESSQDA
ncbi:hypothetical protein [Streptomyces iranensis]|uniref:Uncharacterized protein n=1 Tax=Streptomyces iranensis TaxID=576784 RepID=A0A060ZZI8_9ACTN|nr:hypothetical protein [Streptomyces iranensis]MBP2064612.1 hypothetical protein [Streptomyces iranensis]CDR12707.1 predicted protein [Streptomyces iranensis]